MTAKCCPGVEAGDREKEAAAGGEGGRKEEMEDEELARRKREMREGNREERLQGIEERKRLKSRASPFFSRSNIWRIRCQD